eukprot:5663127-Prorocentrum_lima.AAC.1
MDRSSDNPQWMVLFQAQAWPTDRHYADPLRGTVGRCQSRSWTNAVVLELQHADPMRGAVGAT